MSEYEKQIGESSIKPRERPQSFSLQCKSSTKDDDLVHRLAEEEEEEEELELTEEFAVRESGVGLRNGNRTLSFCDE